MAAEAAHDAFIHALSSGMWLSASVAAAGVVIALTLIGNRPAHHDERRHRSPEAAAAEEAVPVAG